MLEVIKYQLKNRRNTILFLLSVFGGLNVIAWGLEAFKIIQGDTLHITVVGFWIPVAIAAQSITTIIMFFLCSSGHTKSLLYKDTSYLWLTVPRRGWEILGGRFVAGAIEFAAYGIPVAVFMSIHAAMGAWGSGAAGEAGLGFFGALGFMYRQVFVVNFVPFLQILLIGLLAFMTSGFILMFAIVASRSFVRNRGAATAASIALFVLVSNWTMRLGVLVSEQLGWMFPINLTLEPSMVANSHFTVNGMPLTNTVNVPIAALLFMAVLAAGLFAAASWLMEKKVEV